MGTYLMCSGNFSTCFSMCFSMGNASDAIHCDKIGDGSGLQV